MQRSSAVPQRPLVVFVESPSLAFCSRITFVHFNGLCAIFQILYTFEINTLLPNHCGDFTTMPTNSCSNMANLSGLQGQVMDK